MKLPQRILKPAFLGLGLATRAMTLGVKAFVIDGRAGGERVLLVRHTYVPGWHLPGGGVERRETIWDAVEKEVREETHVRIAGRPALFGFYKNTRTSPFDHVAMFVVRDWSECGPFKPNREIAECAFFPTARLPPETTEATVDRVAEVLEGRPPAERW